MIIMPKIDSSFPFPIWKKNFISFLVIESDKALVNSSQTRSLTLAQPSLFDFRNLRWQFFGMHSRDKCPYDPTWNLLTIFLFHLTIHVPGVATYVQGDLGPRGQISKGQSYKEILVRGDFCPRKLLPVLYFLLDITILIELRIKKNNMNSHQYFKIAP